MPSILEIVGEPKKEEKSILEIVGKPVKEKPQEPSFLDKTKKFFKDLEDHNKGVRDVPLKDMLKEAVASSVHPLAPLFVKEPKTPIVQNVRSSLSGLVRGASLGHIDPQSDEELTNVDEVFRTMGDLAGFALPISAGQKVLKAAKLAGKGAHTAKTVLGESLLGATIGATQKLEGEQGRVTNIVTNAALFGGATAALSVISKIPALVTVGGVAGAATEIAKEGDADPKKVLKRAGVGAFSGSFIRRVRGRLTKSAQIIKNDYDDVVRMSKDNTKGAVDNGLDFSESKNILTSFDKPEIQASVVGEVGDAGLRKIRRILTITNKKTEKIASLRKSLSDDMVEIPNQLKAVSDEISALTSTESNLTASQVSAKLSGLKKSQRSLSAKKAKFERINETIVKLENEVKALKDTTHYKRAVKLGELGIDEFDAVSRRGVALDPIIAKQVKEAKDIGGSIFTQEGRSKGATTLDPKRIATKMDGGDPNGIINRLTVEPARKALSEKTLEAKSIRGEFNELIKKSGLRIPGFFEKNVTPQRAKEMQARNARLFDFAEGKIKDPKELEKITPSERELVDWTKRQYKSLLDRINAENRKFGLAPVKERPDYVTHLQEESFLQSLGRMISTDRNEFVKSNSTAFRFAKERLGDEAEKDIITAFNTYLDPALNRIHMTKVGAQVQAYSQVMKPKSKKFWDKWVREALYGEATGLDKLAPEWWNQGAAKFTAMTSKGLLLANVGTTALQFSTSPLVAAKTSIKIAVNSFMKAFTKKGREFVARNSKELAIREIDIDIPAAKLTNYENWVNYLMKQADAHLVRTSYIAGYEYATNRGLSHEGAKRFGDFISTTTQATYNKVFTPEIFRSKAAKPVTQFQTFTFNLWNSIAADTKDIATHEGKVAAIKNLTRMTAGMIAANEFYQHTVGFKPYEITLPIENRDGSVSSLFEVGKAMADGNLKDKVVFAPERFSFSLFPGGSTAKFGPPATAKIASEAIKFFASDSPKDKVKSAKWFVSHGYMAVPAGNQIQKTIEGLEVAQNESMNIGRKKIKVKDLDEKTRAILLGPTRTKAAQREFESRESIRKKKKSRRNRRRRDRGGR